VPFDFLKRRKPADAADGSKAANAAGSSAATGGFPFEGLTKD